MWVQTNFRVALPARLGAGGRELVSEFLSYWRHVRSDSDVD